MKTKLLRFALAFGFGGACLALRKALYAQALDGKNLLDLSHPLVLALWAITAAGCAALLLLTFLENSAGKEPVEPASSLPAALGCVIAALGTGLTLFLQSPPMEGGIRTAWFLLGALSSVGLPVVAWSRIKGKLPVFGCHAVFTLFFGAHLISHYQFWSSNPQGIDYFHELFALLCLMLFGYQQAAFDAGAGNRKVMVCAGFLSTFFCFAALWGSSYSTLLLAGGLWAATNTFTYRQPAEKE